MVVYLHGAGSNARDGQTILNDLLIAGLPQNHPEVVTFVSIDAAEIAAPGLWVNIPPTAAEMALFTAQVGTNVSLLATWFSDPMTHFANNHATLAAMFGKYHSTVDQWLLPYVSKLNALIDHKLAAAGIEHRNLILAGHSMGAIMAHATATQRSIPCLALVSLRGFFYPWENPKSIPEHVFAVSATNDQSIPHALYQHSKSCCSFKDFQEKIDAKGHGIFGEDVEWLKEKLIPIILEL